MKTIKFDITIKIPTFAKPQAKMLSKRALMDKAKQVKGVTATKLRSLAATLED